MQFQRSMLLETKQYQKCHCNWHNWIVLNVNGNVDWITGNVSGSFRTDTEIPAAARCYLRNTKHPQQLSRTRMFWPQRVSKTVYRCFWAQRANFFNWNVRALIFFFKSASTALEKVYLSSWSPSIWDRSTSNGSNTSSNSKCLLIALRKTGIVHPNVSIDMKPADLRGFLCKYLFPVSILDQTPTWLT